MWSGVILHTKMKRIIRMIHKTQSAILRNKWISSLRVITPHLLTLTPQPDYMGVLGICQEESERSRLWRGK
jgi:hypothetical protein